MNRPAPSTTSKVRSSDGEKCLYAPPWADSSESSLSRACERAGSAMLFRTTTFPIECGLTMFRPRRSVKIEQLRELRRIQRYHIQ